VRRDDDYEDDDYEEERYDEGYEERRYPVRRPLKSKVAAGILGILLGGWGVHRFYLGFVGIGIAQIAVTLCTCGMGGIWGLIEGILILTGSMNEDAEGRPLKD
jgi:TM2 domain-containing membrane protein YozV